MAQITANGSKGHHKFTLDVTESSYSISNNTSDVSFTFKLAPRTNGYNWSGWGSSISYTVTIDGTNYTGTIPSYNGSSTVTLKSDTKSGIEHNSNGTKSISYSFSVSDSTGASYTCGNASASGEMNLTTIPRASSITVADANIGSSTNITINKASNTFTTDLYYKASGQSGFTKIVDKTSLQVYGWTVPTSFYSLIPNSKTISCEFYAVTWNGDTLIGISNHVTATFTANITPTIDEKNWYTTDSLTATLTGNTTTVIKDVSSLYIGIGATAGTGSSMASYTINGVNQASSTRTITNANTNLYEIIVYDTRGNYKTDSITTGFVNYVPLTINGNVTRNQPTDNKVNIAISGNYFNASFGNTSNTLTTQYRYKESTSSTWGNWTNITNTKSGNTYTCTLQISNIDYTKQYDFELRATDKVGTKTLIGVRVSRGIPVYNWDNDEFDINVNTTIGGTLNSKDLSKIFELTSGTWTPTLSNTNNNAPSVNYSYQQGYYFKLGNLVYIEFYIRGKITALNSGDYACIRGLPYSANSNRSFGSQALPIGILYNAVTVETNNTFIANGWIIRLQAGNGASATIWKTSSSDFIISGSGWYSIS